MSAPCPRCGEPLGGRYLVDGQLVCWPCTGIEPLDPPPPARTDWQRFRYAIIDKLIALDPERFWNLGPDRVAGVCPVCKAAPPAHLAVHFHGQAARADLECTLGCPEQEVAAALGLGVTS